MRVSIMAFAICGLFSAASAPALAAPTVYANRADFNAAAGPTIFENFESIFAPGATADFGPFTISESNGGSNVIFTDFAAGATSGRNSANYNSYEGNGINSLATIFFKQPIFSLGLDILVTKGTVIQVGGVVTSTITFTGAGNKFLGISDTSGFTSLTFRASGDPIVGFDSLAFSSMPPGSASAVPEPAAWAMIASGFGLIGAAMRCKRKKSAFRLA